MPPCSSMTAVMPLFAPRINGFEVPGRDSEPFESAGGVRD